MGIFLAMLFACLQAQMVLGVSAYVGSASSRNRFFPPIFFLFLLVTAIGKRNGYEADGTKELFRDELLTETFFELYFVNHHRAWIDVRIEESRNQHHDVNITSHFSVLLHFKDLKWKRKRIYTKRNYMYIHINVYKYIHIYMCICIYALKRKRRSKLYNGMTTDI